MRSIFNLRLFVNTSCGLRPIHDEELFNKKNYAIAPLPASGLKMPAANYHGILEKGHNLTEEDIINFLESKIYSRSVRTNINDFICSEIPTIPGRVSILVPTYKRPVNLKNALLSVISQDYKDKEIIVVSDNDAGSVYEAETEIVLDDLRQEYPDEKIFLLKHAKNINGAAARNTGLLMASGEYICFLDDDDAYLPFRLSKSIEQLKFSSGNVGAVYCGFLGWNSPKDDENRYKDGDLTLELLTLDYKKHYLHTNTATYKKSALFAINGFDETYRRHQDIELNLRFFEKFTIEGVKFSGVKLNPMPSDVSNKIFNIDMLYLKGKFLSSFEYLINKYEKEIAVDIYNKHWAEVSRYMKDSPEVILNEFYSNGPLSVFGLLKK